MSRTRLLVLAGCTTAIALGLVVRLFQISVLENKQFIAQAKRQQFAEYVTLPKRGDIFVQDGAFGKTSLLAQSAIRYSLSVTPRNVSKKDLYAKVLAPFSDVSEEALRQALQEDSWYFRPLRHGLTKEEIETVAQAINKAEQEDNAKIKPVVLSFDESQGGTIYFRGGVFFQREFQRVYPEGQLASQLLGFVNDEGQGRYGLESAFDKQLKGQSGTTLLEQDSLGNLLRLRQGVPGSDGLSYELSIDRNVQFMVEQELEKQLKESEAKSGSVVVMDPKTGGIIAMANYPTYKPADFRQVRRDEIYRFDNPTTSYSWEPGSIFKPLIMAGAIDMGLVTPDTKEDFAGSVVVDGYKIETALRKAYGVETMTEVLTNSDNVAMVWVANKMGNQPMHDYLVKFGFGSKTGIDLGGEINGNLPPSRNWRDVNRATISFGQGVAVTPLQMVRAYSAIANNGTMVEPRVVQAVLYPDGRREEIQPVVGEQVIQPHIAKDVRNMMVATVQANYSRTAGAEGYKVAGKTGTAQVPDPEKGGYIEDAYNHSFVGMAPSDDPKYVMLVKIDQPNLKKTGLFAGATAVPLFGRLSSFLLQYYQIPPTNK